PALSRSVKRRRCRRKPCVCFSCSQKAHTAIPPKSQYCRVIASIGYAKLRFNGQEGLRGNLACGVSNSDLQQLFEAFGTVQSAQVIMDRDTGRSKGFGFVEMGSDAEAQDAIDALNGNNVDGRNLTVNEARPGLV